MGLLLLLGLAALPLVIILWKVGTMVRSELRGIVNGL